MVTDVNGDLLSVVLEGLPSGLQFGSNSNDARRTVRVRGTVATDAAVEDHTVTIAAQDNHHLDVVEATFVITVNAAANAWPVITNPGNKTYQQGAAITAFDIEVSDADGDTVTVGVTGLPPGLSYSSATGQVSGTVSATAGTRFYYPEITANDGHHTTPAKAEFQIRVAGPPGISNPGDQTYNQGQPIPAFDITVTDPDDDPVTVGVTGLPPGLSYSTTTGQVSGTVATDAAVKDYTATITASDGTTEVSETFTITVNAPPGTGTPQPVSNRQPVITDPGDKTYARGRSHHRLRHHRHRRRRHRHRRSHGTPVRTFLLDDDRESVGDRGRRRRRQGIHRHHLRERRRDAGGHRGLHCHRHRLGRAPAGQLAPGHHRPRRQDLRTGPGHHRLRHHRHRRRPRRTP